MTKEELKNKYEKELKNLELKETIEKLLPIPANRIYNAGDKFGIWLTYKVKNIKEALKVISKFELLTFYILKGSTTSIGPKDRFTEKEWNDTSIKEITEYNAPYLDLEKMGKYSTKGSLIFYTKIADYTCKIKIEIESIPFEWNIKSEVKYDKYGNITTDKHDLQFNLEDHRIKWWSSPGTSHYSLFWADMHNFESAISNFIKEEE